MLGKEKDQRRHVAIRSKEIIFEKCFLTCLCIPDVRQESLLVLWLRGSKAKDVRGFWVGMTMYH